MKSLEFLRERYHCRDIMLSDNSIRFEGELDPKKVETLRRFLESSSLIKDHTITENCSKILGVTKIYHRIYMHFVKSVVESENFKTWKMMIPNDKLDEEILYNLNYDYFIKWSQDLYQLA